MATRPDRILLALVFWANINAAMLQAATVAYWRFDSADTFTNDVSGNGNVLVNSGAVFSSDVPSRADGSSGSAYFSNCSMDTLNTLNLTSCTNLTVEWFMKPAQPSGVTAVVWEHSWNAYSSATFGSFAVYMYNGSPQLELHFNTGGTITAPTVPDGTVAGAWHHYAVHIGTNAFLRLYIDYRLIGVTSGTPHAFLDDLFHIGNRVNANYKFTGHLDEFRISDRYLDPHDFIGAPRTLAHWRFEPGNLTNDTSSYGRTLANTGVTSSADTMPAARGSEGSAVFNGASILSTVNTLNLSSCTNLTVEWFMKPAIGNSTAAGIPWEIGNPWDSGKPGSFGAYLNNDGSNTLTLAERRDGTYRMTNAIPGGAAAGTWHHYAALISATNTTATQIRLFIDSKAAGTAWASGYSGAATTFPNLNFTIGARQVMLYPYAGLIDELRITDGILSPEEFLYQPVKGTVLIFH